MVFHASYKKGCKRKTVFLFATFFITAKFRLSYLITSSNLPLQYLSISASLR